ncbi:universal stress protein [Verrucomicrobiales bacterium]|nr:universal stress protein [Verrucomicrobiales bacterium]
MDFSENSKPAAERAVAIAKQDGASLELLHAFATPFMPDGSSLGPSVFMTPLDTAPMIEAATKHLQEWADDLVGSSPDKLDIKVTVKEGISTGNVIVNHLRDTKADLAVLGTRGRTALRKLLLGSTAERLIHEAPCSTLAAKPEGFEYELP